MIEWVKQNYNWVLEIVRRKEGTKGFEMLLRRRMVERTLVWLGKYRRLGMEYELLLSKSEALIYAAMVHLMLGRQTLFAATLAG